MLLVLWALRLYLIIRMCRMIYSIYGVISSIYGFWVVPLGMLYPWLWGLWGLLLRGLLEDIRLYKGYVGVPFLGYGLRGRTQDPMIAGTGLG